MVENLGTLITFRTHPMNANDLFPEELGSLQRLRQKYPDRPYSELLDAIHLARKIMPESAVEDWETVATHILETSMPREHLW